MGPEPPSRTSLGSRLSCVAKTTRCFRRPRSSFGSPFPQISNSAVRKVHTSRSLYDCPEVAVGPGEQRCRVVVATHPAGPKKPRVGVERDGIVYELFTRDLATRRFHRCRCGGTLLASRCL